MPALVNGVTFRRPRYSTGYTPVELWDTPIGHVCRRGPGWAAYPDADSTALVGPDFTGYFPTRTAAANALLAHYRSEGSPRA